MLTDCCSPAWFDFVLPLLMNPPFFRTPKRSGRRRRGPTPARNSSGTASAATRIPPDLQPERQLIRFSEFQARRRLSESGALTETDASAAVIIFRRGGRVRRPSSLIRYPCPLTARNRKESRSRVAADASSSGTARLGPENMRRGFQGYWAPSSHPPVGCLPTGGWEQAFGRPRWFIFALIST